MPKKRKSAPPRPRPTRARRSASPRGAGARRSGDGAPPGQDGGARARRPRARPAGREVRLLVEPELGQVVRALAARILRRFKPDVVVGIARGGVYVGEALAAALGADFHPIRLAKRRRDPSLPPPPLPALPDLHDRKVLVVDDVATSGATLARARALSRKNGSRDVRTAVVVERRGGDARPDFAALRTEEEVAFAWDRPAAEADPGEAGV